MSTFDSRPVDSPNAEKQRRRRLLDRSDLLVALFGVLLDASALRREVIELALSDDESQHFHESLEVVEERAIELLDRGDPVVLDH